MLLFQYTTQADVMPVTKMNVDVQDKRRCSARVVTWDKTCGRTCSAQNFRDTSNFGDKHIFSRVWSEKEYAEATIAQRLRLSLSFD